jgi:hypothetical protein
MLQHQVERMFAGLLAKIRQQRDIAADNRLQRCADRSHDRPRTHNDASH